MQRNVRPLLLLLLTLTGSSLLTLKPATAAGTQKQRDDFQQIEHSLNALSGALLRIGDEKQRQSFARAMIDSASVQQRRARELLDAGHADAARQQLDNAMLTIKSAIATLRNRETLVRSLDFSNPADEYQYELDRYETYRMLVKLLLERIAPDPTKRAAMERLLVEASAQQAGARTRAEAADFGAAISQQERSNKLLLQAIRRGGLYVPG